MLVVGECRAQAASDLGGRSARSLLCCPGSRTQSRFEELSFDVGVGRIWPPISLVGILLDYRRELESLGLWPPEWRVATSSATRQKRGGVTRWSHDMPAGPWRSVSGRCRKSYIFCHASGSQSRFQECIACHLTAIQQLFALSHRLLRL